MKSSCWQVLTRLYPLEQDEPDSEEPDPILDRARELERAGWHAWLLALFSRYLKNPRGELVPFVERHEQFWQWVWNVRKGETQRPLVCIWPRGGAKSTSAELACAAWAARRARRYGLYVGASQDRADDHVGNVAGMLTETEFAELYPLASQRRVGRYGNARGWRRNRLVTASGFVLDALGLDTVARGVKIDAERPDFFVLDDIDDISDGPGVIASKLTKLSSSILGSGSNDAIVLGCQNLIHPDSIFSRLATKDRAKRLDILANRIISGPFPALYNMVAKEHQDEEGGIVWKIVSGQPSWPGQDLEACQILSDRIGISTFRREAQHELESGEGSLYEHITFAHCELSEMPRIVRWCAAVDPATTDKDKSDSNGIQIDGLAESGKVYRRWSWEKRSSPIATIKLAMAKLISLQGATLVIETDQGGDTWISVINDAYREIVQDIEAFKALDDSKLTENKMDPDYIAAIVDIIRLGIKPYRPRFRSEKAGAGFGSKVHRQQQQRAAYELGRFIHVLNPTTATLETALKRFPIRKPFDLADGSFWSWRELCPQEQSKLATLSQGKAAGWAPAKDGTEW